MLNEPTGRTHCYGIVTTPIGCRAVFGAEPVQLRGRVVNLVDVWPRAERLRTALLEAADGACGLDLLRRALEDLREPAELGLQRTESVVRRLTRDPVESIGDMAARLEISHGHLDRQFTAVVGLNPRTFARILRVRSLVGRLDVAKPIDWYVWRRLTDWPEAHRWMPGVQALRAQGPDQVGTAKVFLARGRERAATISQWSRGDR